LGIIGSAWAKNLIEDGFTVETWNRTPREFPGFTRDIAGAAGRADVLIIVVADPDAVSAVLDRIESSLHEGQIVVQSSTISAHWTRIFAERVEKSGARYLEAPFTGSRLAAQARQTVFYLGGDNELIDRARPVLQPLAKTLLHIGPVGSASTLKLSMNLTLAAMSAALCEGLNLCRENEISDEVFFDALHQNVGRSGLSDLKEPKLKERDYTPQFSVKHMNKDLRLALESGTPGHLPVTTAVRALYEKGVEQGMADDDFVGLIRLLE
jgi:3-hydroxyisobutyrate dehydrogenase-like beta-hydroxyacid dehydrogenase